MKNENTTKILLVDDESINNKMLKIYIEDYFKINHSSKAIRIDFAEQGYEALGMHIVNQYDFIMLDVKMPKYDGLKFLSSIRQNSDVVQPKICMVTSLGEEKHKTLFRLKGANSYIIKPYNKDMIFSVLQRFIPILEVKEYFEEDSFEFEFDDLDGEGEPWIEEQMTHANSTHKKLPSAEFISEFEGDLDLYLELIEEADQIIDSILKQLDFESFFALSKNIEFVLSKYGTFLNNFVEFYEVSYAVHTLNKIVHSIEELDSDKKGHFSVNLIRCIIEDLYTWKETVFIKQEANDVFYINASILSNCIQLENSLKKVS